MPVVKSYRELTAPDLVKKWKSLVNDNVQMGRDSHLIKARLEYLTPVQILLGMYQYTGEKTISIPQFLSQVDEWLIFDETAAEIELAIAISHTSPPAYRIWRDLAYEEPTFYNLNAYKKAKEELIVWADRILS